MLLSVVVIVTLVCAAFADRLWRARREKLAVAQVLRVGGSVQYDYEIDSDGWFNTKSGLIRPSWLRKLTGHALFASIVGVNLVESNVTDGRVADLDLEIFQKVELSKQDITDAALAEVAKWWGLTHLGLNGTQVTDGGLANLKGLIDLESFHLRDTQITDTGLEHLKKMKKLRHLIFVNSPVTQAGVDDLQQELPQVKISWGFQGEYRVSNPEGP